MRYIYLSLFIFINSCLFAQKDYSCEIWDVVNMVFHLDKNVLEPFDIEFGAIFSNPSGVKINVPGFYNDNNEWVIRFCPDIKGKWIYTTFSTLPELSARKGIVSVSKNTDQNEHGPVRISDRNKRKFSYADGTPYFMMAFELDWLFALDVQNENDIPLTKQIISHVAQNKFNQVIMNVYAYDAPWGEKDKIKPEHNFAMPEVFPFRGSNDNPDYSELNIDFFKHLDRVIAHLDDVEIISHLMIYVWNKKVNWPEPDSKADNMYFDYVVKRYQAFPNLIWDISKEALAYGRDDMSYITGRIDRLRKLDGHKRLLSVHDYSYCSAYPGKVDFISIQEWRPNIYDEMLKVYKKHNDKPVFNIEHGGYEKTMYSIFDGAYTDAAACLDRNYKCIFAGTYSTYYWQNSSWYNIVPDPFSLPEGNWPKFHYYKNMVNLFTEYNFNDLEPTQSTFTTYCLTDSDKLYMFYLTDNMIVVQGDVPELKDKRVKIMWFDAFTGDFYESGEREFKNGTWLHFPRHEKLTSPFAVLILKVIN